MVRIARDLNEREIPRRGTRWVTGTLSQLLNAPGFAGPLPRDAEAGPEAGPDIFL